MTGRRHWLFFWLLTLAASLGVALTSLNLSRTADEEFHFAAGMQWWQKGIYTIEPKHTPLTRIVMAAPEALGKRYFGLKSHTATLEKPERYKLHLTLMRLPLLIFYVLSCYLVYRWSRELFGDRAALWSLAFYGVTSTVTAHAALATTDLGYTVMYLWALMSALAWLKQPTTKNALLLGATVALMVSAKYSGLVQLPAALALIFLALMFYNWWRGLPIIPIGMAHIRSVFLFSLPAALAVFLHVYRFDLRPLVSGFYDLVEQNRGGFALWLFEKLPPDGVWYFFPVVYFFKVSIPFHVMTLLTHGRLGLELRRGSRSIEVFFPLLAAAGVMGVSMTSNINLGVRHVLPIYPLLAVPAGYGIFLLWESGSWKRILAVLLLLWQVYGYAKQYPDQVSFYNEFGGRMPERISNDSDFDWGQGLMEVERYLRGKDLRTLHMCARRVSWVNAPALMPHINWRPCLPRDVTRSPYYKDPRRDWGGFFLVSRTEKMIRQNRAEFAWLKRAEPLNHIGHTMDLYYIKPAYEYVQDLTSDNLPRVMLCTAASFELRDACSQAAFRRDEDRKPLRHQREHLLSGI